MGQFHFTLSAHPREYSDEFKNEPRSGAYVESQREEGFRVRDPSEDWLPYILACDVIVADHTSLVLNGVMLGKPVVLVPVADDLIMEGSARWRLREISPIIAEDASNLRECLLRALHDYPFDEQRKLAADINSYPGQSAERVLEEIYSLLKLPAP
jgi:hypothetical protein